MMWIIHRLMWIPTRSPDMPWMVPVLSKLNPKELFQESLDPNESIPIETVAVELKNLVIIQDVSFHLGVLGREGFIMQKRD